jgi:hypothetical protein
MHLIHKMRSAIVGSLLLFSIGSGSLNAAGPSGGSNQYANSSLNYGVPDANCVRTKTNHYFCDLCGTFWPLSCPGCTSASLPPDSSAGTETGKPTTTTSSATGCFSAATQAQAQGQIPAGATNIKLTSSTSGYFCFSWTTTSTYCKF